MERCWSGLTGLPAKQLHGQKLCRGFESHPLRQFFYIHNIYRMILQLVSKIPQHDFPASGSVRLLRCGAIISIPYSSSL